MKIGKATFDCTIGMPGFSNVKPGVVEIVLEEGETIEDAWSELNRRALAWHRKEFPHLYEQPSPPLSYFGTIKNPGSETSEVKKMQDEESDCQLKEAIEALQKIQYKEDAEIFMGTERWMKYNKIIKSIVNAKPIKS